MFVACVRVCVPDRFGLFVCWQLVEAAAEGWPSTADHHHYQSLLAADASACSVPVPLSQIASAFDSAMRAAAAVQVPQDADPADAAVQRRMVWERRHAAEKELKRQLSKLGLDTSSLNLQGLASGSSSQQQAPRDLLSLARPLV